MEEKFKLFLKDQTINRNSWQTYQKTFEVSSRNIIYFSFYWSYILSAAWRRGFQQRLGGCGLAAGIWLVPTPLRYCSIRLNSPAQFSSKHNFVFFDFRIIAPKAELSHAWPQMCANGDLLSKMPVNVKTLQINPGKLCSHEQSVLSIMEKILFKEEENSWLRISAWMQAALRTVTHQHAAAAHH